MKRAFPFLVLLVVCAVSAGAQDGFVNGVQMTTIKAPFVLRILGQDLDIANVEAKPDEQSAYFMMTSEATKLNVSVFIEPVDKCKTTEACRDHVLESGNAGWGVFRDLSKGKLGDASYFELYRPEVMGQPLRMFDMYAEFVRDGYWVDVHISKATYEKKEHAVFEKMVESVAFVAKSADGASAFDSELAKGAASAASWLDLWDNGKCAETYAALSAISKADTSEKGWIDYCKKGVSVVGKKKSRILIGAALTSSLAGKTDRPLAILAYHSSFANQPSMVELVGLLLDKDGKWIVTNYLPQ